MHDTVLMNPMYIANPLLAAARPLILLLINFHDSPQPENSLILRDKIIQAFEQFEKMAKRYSCEPRLILAARYCLCTALDETILANSWAIDSIWSQQSFLSLFHRETWGGERFFILLEKMYDHPQENIDLLELFFVLLTMGFEGKYYNQGKAVLNKITHHLYTLIIEMRDSHAGVLSPSLIKSSKVFMSPIKSVWWYCQNLCYSMALIFAAVIITNIAIYESIADTLQAVINLT